MEKRELAEKIVLAMLQSWTLQLAEIKCSSYPPRETTLEDMKQRAKIIDALIDATHEAISSK